MALFGCGTPKGKPSTTPRVPDSVFTQISGSLGQREILESFEARRRPSEAIVILSPEKHQDDNDWQINRAKLLLKTGKLERYYVEGFVNLPGSQEWKDSIKYYRDLFNVDESKLDKRFDSKIRISARDHLYLDKLFEECPQIQELVCGIETPRSAKINAISSVGAQVFIALKEICNLVSGNDSGVVIATPQGTCNLIPIAQKLHNEANKQSAIGFPNLELASLTKDPRADGMYTLITKRDIPYIESLREQVVEWIIKYSESERTKDWSDVLLRRL